MKNTVLFIFSMFLGLAALSQTDMPPPPPPKDSVKQILDFAEEMPEYPGGLNALRFEVASAYRVPSDYISAGGRGGTIVLRFVVEEDGGVGESKIMKGFGCESCNAEALKVIRNLKNTFVPGRQAGEPIKVWYTIPIIIMIQGNNKKKNKRKKR